MAVKGVSFSGLSPKDYASKSIRDLVKTLNEEGLQIESEVVADSPANFGRLKGGWVFTPATENKPRAVINQSVDYFLPVEMGRAPGKGISPEGQKKVVRWAKLVLKLKDGGTFAYLLSQKYKREGRPAVGFVGLSKPGVTPQGAGKKVPQNPVSGSLLDKAFKRLRERVRKL